MTERSRRTFLRRFAAVAAGAAFAGTPSAGAGRAGALARDRAFARAFLIRRADRLLFGSDYLEPGQDVPQFKLLDEFQLPPEVEARICRENARRLLGLG